MPDLRLRYADSRLSLDEDRAEARHLAERAGSLDFAGLLALHWERTGKPRELVERFVARETGTDERSRAYVSAIEEWRGSRLGAGERFLEVGCGTGGLAVAAAARAGEVVASDLSLRWLVLARKRLDEAGLENVLLICCGAEDPALEPESFDVVAAADVIEHTEDAAAFVRGCHRLLRDGGTLFLATPNRYSLALEPHVRLWGVGLLPRSLAKRYVQRLRRTSYDHVRLLSARALRGVLEQSGFRRVHVVPPEIGSETQQLYAGLELRLVRMYNSLRRLRPVRRLLRAVGPFFHVFATKGDR